MDKTVIVVLYLFGLVILDTACLNITVSELMDELVGSDYDAKSRPGELTGGQTEVKVSVYIQSITSIDAIKMEITLTCLLFESWTDDRLASDKFNDSVHLAYSEYDRLWLPDLYFPNERDADLHTSPLPNRLFQLTSDGQLQYTQRITLKLGCDMDLFLYPLDNQTCRIYVESFTYNTDQMTLVWGDQTQLSMATDARLPEFDVTDLMTGECEEDNNPLTGSFPCIYGEIHLQRDRNYYFAQVYMPSMIVVTLSWVNFWIDAAAVPARVSLAILTVVTINSQNSGITAKLPRESYTKAIDVWMSACMLFVFAGLIEYCLVNVFNRKERTDKDFEGRDVDSDNDDPLEDEEVDIHNDNPLAQGHRSKTKSITTWTKSVKLVKIQHKSLKKRARHFAKLKWRRWSTSKGMLIDVISRILFPVAFLIFNFVYWLVYLVFPMELGLFN